MGDNSLKNLVRSGLAPLFLHTGLEGNTVQKRQIETQIAVAPLRSGTSVVL